MIHFKRWCIAMGVMVTAYLGYAVLAAPWIEPPPYKAPVQVAGPKPQPLPRKQHDLAHLFPAGSWQLQNPKVIETETSLLLFHDYQPQADGKLDVTPCTVIMFAGKDADSQRRPIVLDAPAGAVLQFDRQLDFANAKMGELLGGKLPGDIRIFRIPSSIEANDGLELTTRNVQIDMQRLWTPHEVRFRYGPSYGSGRDLSIYLLPKDDTLAGNKGPLGALQRLELSVVDVIHVEPPPPAAANNAPALVASQQPPAQPMSPFEIRCRGPFQFDFLNHHGMFKDDVEVVQLNPQGPADSLRCQYLAIHLRSPDDIAKAKAANPTPAATAGGAMALSPEKLKSQLASIEASGDQVVLNAPSQGAHVTAARFAHNFVTRRLVLEPGPRSPQVSLRYGEQAFTAKRIDYEMPLTGRLGTLLAEGPGEARVVQTEGTSPMQLQFQWQDKLRIDPQEQPTTKLLTMKGKARVNAENLGAFGADEISVWLREVATPPMPENRPATANPAQAMGIEPDRLLATGTVEIDTPQLVARSPRFEAWFITPTVPPVNPALNPTLPLPQNSGPPGLSPPENAGGNIPARSVSTAVVPLTNPQPQFGQPFSGGMNPPINPAAPTSRFEVTGDLIRAQLIRLGPTGVVEDLAVKGNVRVTESQTAFPDEVPVTMQGEVLQLQKGSTPDAIVHLAGQPAVLTARGMKLVGEAVKMHRGDNRIWIDGQGEADIPLSREFFAPPGVPQIPASVAAVVERPQLAKVTWKGGAKFDGQTLTVAKNVVARTEQERQLLMAELLIVTLDRFIDLQKPVDRPPQIATMRVDGGVYVENRTFDLRGEPISRDQFQVKNFTVDQRTGEIKAEGPGWLSSARVGGTSLAGGTAPIPRPNEVTKLTYLRATFQGDVVGSLTNREIQFQRQVRAVVGPIANWSDKFDPQSLEELGESGVIVTSDQVTVAELRQGASQATSMEFNASGNTLVEGKGFVAKSQRISYSTAKEQLIVEGEGRTAAELWYRPGPGKPEAYQAARKIKFNRRQSSIEVEDAQSIDLNQITGPSPRLMGKGK